MGFLATALFSVFQWRHASCAGTFSAMPRFAAIDVGSNALRLRVVEAACPSEGSRNRSPKTEPSGSRESSSGWTEIASERASVRLGSGVFTTGGMTAQSITQACTALRDFRQKMTALKVDAYRATATSAVRESDNRATLVERARREADIELEVIEGVEEARLVQLAVSRRVRINDRRAMLVDVGGGSTELTALDRGENTFSMSLALGTVRLLQNFLQDASTLDASHFELLNEAIDRAIGEAVPHIRAMKFDVMLGTGGNLETLAQMAPATGKLDFRRAIDVKAARARIVQLAAMTPAQRSAAFGLRSDRADTIIPAALTFVKIAELIGLDTIIAPGVGLKEGLLEELVDRFFRVWDTEGEAASIIAACVRLGRRYHFDQAHGERVTAFGGQLFDDFQAIHGLMARDRLLLRAAAMLHDVGDFVRYEGHHKHSHYIIQNSDIMGLSPNERAVVANVARYHRKGVPDAAHPNFRDLDRDARAKVRGLAGILRIADALDREHLGKVSGVRARVDRARNVAFLTLEGKGERQLEEWSLRMKSDLFRDVYGLDIVLAR